MEPERNISILNQMVWPSLFAALVQLAVVWSLGIKIVPLRILGGMIVSGGFGAGVSLFCSEVLHLTPVFAATIGGLSGSMPVVFIYFLVLKWVSKRLGIDLADLNQMLDTIRSQMENQRGTDPMPPVEVPEEMPAPEPIDMGFPEPQEASPYDPA